MATLSEVNVPHRDRALAEHDPTLGHAIERVVDAGQGLIVRRIDLLVEEISGLGSNLIAGLVSSAVGVALALVGWLIAIAGLIDALDERFARHWVEIAIGLAHLGAGVTLLWRRKLARAAS